MVDALGLYYLPEGFDTGQAKLMGRHAAGEGFLKGLARYGKLDRLYCYTRNQPMTEDFKTRFGQFGGAVDTVRLVPFEDIAGLSAAGCLFLPGPGIDQYAWSRRRIGQRSYSLTGVTHTTASEAVMQTVANLMTAPVQAWDAVICTTQVVRNTFTRILEAYGEYLARKLGCSLPKTDIQLPVIPLGVDCEQFAPTHQTEAFRQAWRTRLGIGPEDHAVLFVGRLSFHAKAHPHPMYVALEKAAQKTGKTIHLMQAGWFANEHIQKAFAEGAQKLSPSVRHHFLDGRKAEVRQQIWFAADSFCSLSDNIQETFGLTPIEAMAAGLPQVVSDWNGYKETVRHEVDGFRIPTLAVEPGMGEELALRYELDADNYDMYCGNACNAVSVDIAAAADAFVKLAEDAELRRKMGEAARTRVRETFDWKVVIASYHRLWDELESLRKSAAETMALEPGEPQHPFRQDPFSLFASYPTRVIHESSRLFPAKEASLDHFHAIRQMAMHNFGHRLPPETAAKLLEAILREPGVSAYQLSARVTEANTGLVMRTLVWFAKVGLITVSHA